MRLRAPSPGWSAAADVVVIGSGVAGLTTALQIRAHNLSVMLITKARVDEGSTKWAQGGIAAALGPGDSPDQHERDTLVAVLQRSVPKHSLPCQLVEMQYWEHRTAKSR